VAMADLRAIIGGLGYADVRTLLNSGNVVFAAPNTASGDLAARIRDVLADRLELRTTVIVLSAAEIADVLAKNPLSGLADDPSRMLVAFLAATADRARWQVLLQTDWTPEAVGLGERVAYLWCPMGVAASPLVQAIGRESGDAVTMRNWATVAKIGALMTQDRQPDDGREQTANGGSGEG